MTKTNLGLTISLFALGSAAGLSQPVQAADLDKVIHDCRKGVDLKVSGQINQALLYADDGHESDIFIVDNDNSSTRFRFVGKGQINCDWQVGTTLEFEWESNSTGDIKIGQKDSVDGKLKERKVELWFKGPLGKLSLGQGDAASNGIAEVDLSKTGVAAHSSVASMAGGILFFGTGLEIKDVSPNLDGSGRLNRVRYDTPTFAGFTLSTSYSDNNLWDVALKYAQALGDFRVAGAIGYANPDPQGGDGLDFADIYAGSLSIRHAPTGLNVTVAAGNANNYNGGETGFRAAASVKHDAQVYYAKLGWLADLSNIGHTAFSVDYQKTNDFDVKGDKFHSYGAAIVQNFEGVGVEIYGAARWHEVDLTGVPDPDGIFAAMVGSRIKF